MGESDMRFRVGYALKPEKVASVIQPSLITHSKQRGIDLIQVDLSKPLVDQGPFHCLVHKLYTSEWKHQMLEFRSVYPDAVLIDNLSDIERLHDRASMLEAVSTLTQTSIRTPKQVVVYEVESLLSNNSLSDLSFPVIAKPLLANGNDGSHEMCVVFNSGALNKVTPPVVLQEFVDHDGVLFKVYVAGDHVKCVKRTSLPNVSGFAELINTVEALESGIMPFSQVSSADASARQEKEPPLDLIHGIAKGLRDATKLHLFNFDIIRDARAGSENMYFIIDINYFPGYAKVSGFENMLTDFFWDIVTHNHLDTTATEDETVDAAQEDCNLNAAEQGDLPPVIATPESTVILCSI
ncbi:inositol-tetrakisphosphate 1-kinase 2-like [Silene latifolia]|uniref:inositol-tetrakisphosphate 1-kinase 2-like n=1 Tax=Silene latifolia TaxID=37657 RepID=UPI003D77BBA2